MIYAQWSYLRSTLWKIDTSTSKIAKDNVKTIILPRTNEENRDMRWHDALKNMYCRLIIYICIYAKKSRLIRKNIVDRWVECVNITSGQSYIIFLFLNYWWTAINNEMASNRFKNARLAKLKKKITVCIIKMQYICELSNSEFL